MESTIVDYAGNLVPRTINSDSVTYKFITYPGETVRECAFKGITYYLTNYGRIYNGKTNNCVKVIGSKSIPKLMSELFDSNELDNIYFKTNVKPKVNTSYINHREERLQYQREYRNTHLEACRERERKYKEAHKQEISEYNRKRYQAKKAANNDDNSAN